MWRPIICKATGAAWWMAACAWFTRGAKIAGGRMHVHGIEASIAGG